MRVIWCISNGSLQANNHFIIVIHTIKQWLKTKFTNIILFMSIIDCDFIVNAKYFNGSPWVKYENNDYVSIFPFKTNGHIILCLIFTNLFEINTSLLRFEHLSCNVWNVCFNNFYDLGILPIFTSLFVNCITFLSMNILVV